MWRMCFCAIEASRLEVVKSHSGGGRGDCSHCPASEFPARPSRKVQRPVALSKCASGYASASV